MAALATSADVEAQLGRSLTSAEEERVEAALRYASVRARIRTGRQFTPGTYTSERSVRNGRVAMPETVASVEEVRVVYSDGSTEVVDEDAWVLRRNTIYGLTYHCRVEVDYTVSADVPEDIVDAVAAIAAHRVQNPGVAGAAESETVGPFTIRYRDGSSALTTEAEVFARFAAPLAGPIVIL
jgi:hypothetical protein